MIGRWIKRDIVWIATLVICPVMALDVCVAQDVIRIGVVHSMTGPAASVERPLADVVRMLAAEQNAKGGLLGKKIEVVLADPGSDPFGYATKARELIVRDRVSAIFGGYSSVSRRVMIPVLKETNSILFYPAQYEGEESERNVFYTGTAPNQRAIPAVSYLKREEGVQRWVLAGTDGIYPRTTNRIIAAYLRSQGVRDEDIFVTYAAPGREEWGRIVDDILKFGLSNKKTAIVSSFTGRNSIEFYKELSQQRIEPRDTPVIDFTLGEIQLVGVDTAPLVGRLAAGSYFESIENPANREFINKWRAFSRNAHEVTYEPMDAHFVGFSMWVSAVERARSTDVDKVVDAIVGMRAQSLSGGVSEMLPNHHITKPMFIGKVRPDGQFDLIWKSREWEPAEAWSKEIPESADFISDWKTLMCGSFNTTTKKCSIPQR